MPEIAIAAAHFTPYSGLLVVIVDWSGMLTFANKSDFAQSAPDRLTSTRRARERYLHALGYHLKRTLQNFRGMSFAYVPQHVRACLKSPDKSLRLGSVVFRARLLVDARTIKPEETWAIAFPLVYYTPPGTPRRSGLNIRPYPPILPDLSIADRLISYAMTVLRPPLQERSRRLVARIQDLAFYIETDSYNYRRRVRTVSLFSVAALRRGQQRQAKAEARRIQEQQQQQQDKAELGLSEQAGLAGEPVGN